MIILVEFENNFFIDQFVTLLIPIVSQRVHLINETYHTRQIYQRARNSLRYRKDKLSNGDKSVGRTASLSLLPPSRKQKRKIISFARSSRALWLIKGWFTLATTFHRYTSASLSCLPQSPFVIAFHTMNYTTPKSKNPTSALNIPWVYHLTVVQVILINYLWYYCHYYNI